MWMIWLFFANIPSYFVQGMNLAGCYLENISCPFITDSDFIHIVYVNDLYFNFFCQYSFSEAFWRSYFVQGMNLASGYLNNTSCPFWTDLGFIHIVYVNDLPFFANIPSYFVQGMNLASGYLNNISCLFWTDSDLIHIVYVNDLFFYFFASIPSVKPWTFFLIFLEVF